MATRKGKLGAEAGAGFDSKGIGLRAQKKILGKMSTKRMAKVFIDDSTGELLDYLYKLTKEYTGSKKESEKLMKDIIKIVVKIGILYRNDQFNKDELILAERFRKKFRSTVMSVISFYEVDYSFDRNYLVRSLKESRDMLNSLIDRHLTDKSHGRVEHVFKFFADEEFLDTLFESDSQLRQHLVRIIAVLNRMIDEGSI
ncbi:tumor necrosis factor, alpha-induced protein 8-like protein 2 B [Saccoglossus kowalevskii]|uniref:Tumor necrosis factor alpha-induced protein 8-like protein 3-like n=1 Tax=Saccoglossus kowalevskii TaxID=10224 RepID=A0ABM0MVD5_SACKO|nr:PREDICTED: tumor necrosis factor alpha-induced protein 8-like protein 3-like [Saccoglossus kowalevskii]